MSALSNKHRCAQTRRKEIVTTGDRCNHWPFTLLTIHPLFTESTDNWHIIKCNSSLYPCMVKLSKNSDWSACYLTHSPFSLIGQLVPTQPSLLPDWSVWMGPYTPSSLWLVRLNEHMLLCEWAHNHGEIQWKIKKATDRITYIRSPKPVFSAGKKNSDSVSENK